MINVDQKESTEKNNKIFIVHLPDEELQLQLKQDTEGANHWLNLKTNLSNNEAKEIGEIIEAYFMKNNITM